MQEQFVPFELALLLKEKGFDQQCLAYYIKNRLQFPLGVELTNQEKCFYITGGILAPLYQQAVEWLEKTFKLEINVYSANGEGKEWYFLVLKGTRASNDVVYTNRVEATKNAIVKAIETYSI